MQIIIEDIDGVYYADVILMPNEIQKLHQAEIITNEVNFKRRKCYVGIRLQGVWDYDPKEIKKPKKGFESDAGVLEGRPTQRVKGRPRRDE